MTSVDHYIPSFHSNLQKNKGRCLWTKIKSDRWTDLSFEETCDIQVRRTGRYTVTQCQHGPVRKPPYRTDEQHDI